MRLKLYLSICLLAVGPPHDVFGTAYIWAELLGLPDYDRRGARRVRDALQWLHREKLIRIRRVRGKNPRVYLLSQAGTGNAYRRPPSHGVPYATLPVEFWANGWILKMSARAIAVLLVLLQCQHGRPHQEFFWIRDSWRYDLSADTWARGTAELSRLALLEQRQAVRGDELELRRRRNLYWVNMERFKQLASGDVPGDEQE